MTHRKTSLWLGLAALTLCAAVTTAQNATPDIPPAPTAPAALGPVEWTNYRSGIAMELQGRNGTDYAVERFYYDAPLDDHGVIYIRSSTKLSFTHNELNTYINSTRSPFKEVGANGPDGKPNSGDEGVIRYKVDRDQLLGLAWSKEHGAPSSNRPLNPAFEKPFAFSELEFEPGVKVIGSVGPKPDAKPGPGFYYRGVRDTFGDEWHILTVVDDDGGFRDNSRQQASDGKIILFVVDPQTPCLSLRTRSPQAQYYTTPAKTYFLPYIYEQTSYVTDGVDVLLTNITNDQPVSCSINAGPPRRYAGALRSEDLKDGRNVLEYWIEGGPRKTRTIVKNPPYPSAGETHPKLLWANDAELTAIKARLQREPYKAYWDRYHSEYTHHDAIERVLGRGSRAWAGSALENALVAYIDGPKATAPGGKRPFASYAKQILLDNKLKLDPVGLELAHHTDPIPTPEWNYFGYWVCNEVFDLALGYDVLISSYRADQVPGGITPIEDLKIRDNLAHWIVVQLEDLRGFESTPDRYRKGDASPGDGMWDTARLASAAVAAMAMPNYDSNYYGTSGFDGKTRATHENVPFGGQAFTWKSLFIDADQPVGESPKLRRRFNPFEGGLVKPDGSFHDRSPYYTYPLMGHVFLILANTAKLGCDKSWPFLEKSFENSIDGTMEGHKVNSPGDAGKKRFVHILLVNRRFPQVAAKIRDFVALEPSAKAGERKNPNSLDALLYETSILGLLWYQDDFDKPGK